MWGNRVSPCPCPQEGLGELRPHPGVWGKRVSPDLRPREGLGGVRPRSGVWGTPGSPDPHPVGGFAGRSPRAGVGGNRVSPHSRPGDRFGRAAPLQEELMFMLFGGPLAPRMFSWRTFRASSAPQWRAPGAHVSAHTNRTTRNLPRSPAVLDRGWAGKGEGPRCSPCQLSRPCLRRARSSLRDRGTQPRRARRCPDRPLPPPCSRGGQWWP